MTRIDLRLDTAANPPRAAHYRVLLDGVDVSADCFMCDDVTGEVGLFLRNADGAFYPAWAGLERIDTPIDPSLQGPALEYRSGVVTLIPPAAE